MSKKNQQSNQMPPLNEKDDALFEELGKNRKKKKRKIIRIVLSIVLVLALVLGIGTAVLRKRVREQFGMDNVDVKSYAVTTGTISTVVSGSGTNEGGNSKFTVDITVNKASDMLPGMTAYATITLATMENVLCIPVAALTESGTETIVYTGYDEKNETFTGPITVTVGLSDGEYAQILSGLGEGQEIYYPYYDTLVISNAAQGSGFLFG